MLDSNGLDLVKITKSLPLKWRTLILYKCRIELEIKVRMWAKIIIMTVKYVV